jgi:cytochrome c-type biogenesis protein CcmH/NrfF
MTRLVVVLWMLSGLASAAESTAAQKARIAALQNMFLAPCCYSEPVSRHRSEVALTMQAEIARWVAEGKSNREIIDTYKQRYGTRVLVEPEGAPWWWMHVVPWIVLALAGAALVAWLRRMKARGTPPAPPAALLPTSDDWDL